MVHESRGAAGDGGDQQGVKCSFVLVIQGATLNKVDTVNKPQRIPVTSVVLSQSGWLSGANM